MGNTESSSAEGEGTRKQEKPVPKLYRFVDMYGGGELIPWMKYAKDTGDSSMIDEFIETKVRCRIFSINYFTFLLLYYLSFQSEISLDRS